VTTVVFENATFQDVIAKAAKIAPTRGGAFDKAAGVMIEVDSETQEVTVRTTNLDVYYMEVLDAVSIEGDSVNWLLPSVVIEAFANKLPIGSGKQLTLTQEGGYLNLQTGRTKARMHLISNSYYPNWEPFDPGTLTQVNKFSDLLDLVQWAAEKGGTPPLNGICLDGDYIAASDRFKAVRVPLKIDDMSESVVIPVSLTKVLTKHMGDVEVGIRNGQLLVMPDDSTQIQCVLYAEKFPNLHPLFDMVQANPDVVKFKKQNMLEILDRAMVMSGRDRLPTLRMFLVKEKVAVLMVDEHAGQLGDVLDVPGYCIHERHQIIFNPKMLIDAVTKSPNDDVTMTYNQTDPYAKVKIDGGSGYEVIIVPRRDLTPIADGGGDT
jgi:DNA polymerase III sliding clamp (beta) subunit (PCNA family)